MKLTFTYIVYIIVAALFVLGTLYFFIKPASFSSFHNTQTVKDPNASSNISSSTILDDQKEKVEKILNSMTLDEKIGQMLIIGFPTPELDDHIKLMIKEYHVGGVNLLKRNISSGTQVKKLSQDLQSFNTKYSKLPFIISADQEGGDVVRFKFMKELTAEPAIKNTTQAYDVALGRGKELKEYGINMNFSPVLDLVTDKNSYLYSRTFATSSEKIAGLGAAMVKGYEDAGIMPVIKHFPGYGNIKADPHKNAVHTTLTSQDFEQFKSVLEKYSVPVMTAHSIIDDVDTKPATLSSKFLTDILRKQWNYEGVIITDDIEMVSAGSTPANAAVKAVEAGADMIISTYTPQVQLDVFNALKKAVQDKNISEERINESLRRIIALKLSL
jgi:beta-N-acetylhexosaminidase